MDDLISRAAAKFQACNWSVRPNAVIYDGIKEVIKSQLDMAPAVEAIPVEWLREKMKKPLITSANPFDYVLDAWGHDDMPSPTCGPDYCDIN